MAAPVRLTFTPTRIEAAPGDTVSIAVNIRNTSDVVEHYVVAILGLPHGADSHAEPEITKLRPGETGDVTITVKLAAQEPLPAGEYTFGALVRSLYRPEVSRAEELAFVVTPVDGLQLRVQPEVVHAKRGAVYEVRLANTGNVGVGVRLCASDAEDQVDWSFRPDGLQLAPGGTGAATLSVHALRPWSKEKQRAITVDVVGAPLAAPARVTFVQPPRFASRLLRLSGLASGVAVVAAAIVAAAVISRGGSPTTAPTTSAGSSGTTASTSPSTSSSSPSQQSSSASNSSSGGSTSPNESSSAGGSSSSGGSTVPVPQTVDLTQPSTPPTAGILAPNAFTAQGLYVSGAPDSTTLAACAGATSAAVTGDATGGHYVSAALPTDAAQCHDVPLMITFSPHPARNVVITLSAPGTRQMTVVFHDGRQTTAAGLSAADTDGHGGIDMVIIAGVPAGSTPAFGVNKVRFTLVP